MAWRKNSLVLLMALASGALGQAPQQKFPLKQGEWEVSTLLHSATQPIVLHVCLNDELWTKALTQSPKCTIQSLSVWAKGVSYTMECPEKNLKGKVELSFDGKERMSGKASIDATINGTVVNSKSFVEYRWKNPSCAADDLNLKQTSPQQGSQQSPQQGQPPAQPPSQPH